MWADILFCSFPLLPFYTGWTFSLCLYVVVFYMIFKESVRFGSMSWSIYPWEEMWEMNTAWHNDHGEPGERRREEKRQTGKSTDERERKRRVSRNCKEWEEQTFSSP